MDRRQDGWMEPIALPSILPQLVNIRMQSPSRANRVHSASLISISVALSQTHQLILQNYRYRANASCGVPLCSTAFAGHRRCWVLTNASCSLWVSVHVCLYLCVCVCLCICPGCWCRCASLSHWVSACVTAHTTVVTMCQFSHWVSTCLYLCVSVCLCLSVIMCICCVSQNTLPPSKVFWQYFPNGSEFLNKI